MSSGTLIVVPCLNEERHLEALLRQLLRDNGADTIVVSDGGSSDSSRSIVTRLQAEARNLILLDNPLRIQAAGVNLAVERFGAGKRWLARIDAHCRYPDNFVERLVEAAERQKAASVVVPMVTLGETCFQVAAATAQNSVIGTGGSPHRHVGKARFVDHGHHALFAIEAFIAVGGYREDMPANEDAELDCRLAGIAAPIWLEPELAIQYYPRAAILPLARQYFRYGVGRARTARLHGRRLKLRQIVPLGAPASVALASLAPLSWAFLLPLFAWLGLTLGAGLALGLKTGSRCAYLSGVAAATMHLAWGFGFVRGFFASPARTANPEMGRNLT